MSDEKMEKLLSDASSSLWDIAVGQKFKFKDLITAAKWKKLSKDERAKLDKKFAKGLSSSPKFMACGTSSKGYTIFVHVEVSHDDLTLD
jgi:hypothetical protein